MPMKITRASGVAARKLAEAKGGALGDIASMIDNAAAAIIGPVPKAEIAAWGAKAAEARAVLEGSGAGPLLTAEVAGTGETVQELAEKVVANAARYEVAIAELTKLRREAGRRIRVATDADEMRRIVEDAEKQLAMSDRMVRK